MPTTRVVSATSRRPTSFIGSGVLHEGKESPTVVGNIGQQVKNADQGLGQKPRSGPIVRALRHYVLLMQCGAAAEILCFPRTDNTCQPIIWSSPSSISVLLSSSRPLRYQNAAYLNVSYVPQGFSSSV